MPSIMYAGGQTATRTARSSGTPSRDQRVAPRLEGLELAPDHQRGQLGHHLLDHHLEGVDDRLGVLGRSGGASSSQRDGPLDQGADLQPHPGLHRRRRAGCRRTAISRASRLGAEDLAGHEVGLGQLGGGRAGLAGEPVEVGDAGVVDQLVDDLGDHDLAAQLVRLHRGAVALAHPGREVAEQLRAQERVVGQVAGQQVLGQHDLGVRHQHRQLGRAEPLAALAQPGHLAPAGQRLQLAVEQPAASSVRIQSSCTCSSAGASDTALASARFWS